MKDSLIACRECLQKEFPYITDWTEDSKFIEGNSIIRLYSSNSCVDHPYLAVIVNKDKLESDPDHIGWQSLRFQSTAKDRFPFQYGKHFTGRTAFSDLEINSILKKDGNEVELVEFKCGPETIDGIEKDYTDKLDKFLKSIFKKGYNLGPITIRGFYNVFPKRGQKVEVIIKEIEDKLIAAGGIKK